MMRMTRESLGRLSGLLGAFAFLVLYSVAATLDSRYVFGENYLSDLGVGEGAWAFNSGLIVAGLMLVVFSYFGLGPVLGKGVLRILGTVLLMVSAILLMGIGVFTENAGDIHRALSLAFFLEALIAVGVVDVALYKSRSLGRFGPAVSTASFVFGICLLPFGATPLVETIAVFDIIAWGVLISIGLVTKRD